MAPSLFVLLCCTFLLCAGRIEGQSGENDNGEGLFSGSEDRGSGTSGSGSGSGDMPEEDVQVVTESTAAECVDDLSRNDNEGYELTSSTAYTAAMCRLFCMDNTTSNQDTQLENVTIGGGGWMFKSFPQFSTENEKIHCQPYQKFAECVRGCLVRVEPSDATLNSKRCKSQCRQQCKSERDIDDHYFNPYCKVDCNATVCGQGCDNYKRIVTSNTAGSPPSPIQGPRLVSSTLLADVTLSVSKSVPPTSDQEHPLEPVGIVYRVVDKKTNVTRYFQMVSPDDPLDLNDFACRTISVSFVVVNRFGVSRESPPLTLNVPGGNITLRKPTDIELVEQVDKRPGFFGHAVVTISWDHPQDYMEELYYYVLKVTYIGARPGDSRQFSKSPITTNSVTVNDNQTGPDSVFLLDTGLIFEVCTRIWDEDNEECEEKRESLLSVTHLETTVTITDCVRHWNGSHFNYTIHWTVPEFVAYGDGIFLGFLVVAEKKITKRYIRGYDVAKIPNQREYSYKWLDLYPMEEEYQFTVSIQWMASDNYRSPYVYDAKCTKSALPPPPNPVLNVTLSDLEFSEQSMVIQFLVQWNPPDSANGEIEEYLACLGGRRIPDYEQQPGNVKDGNDTACQEIEKEKRSFSWKTRLPRPDCIYFQMRAHISLGGAGNWSTAVVISHRSISKDNTCRTPPTTKQVLAQENSPQRSSQTYIPVLGALGAVVGLALLALLTALTVVCGRIRRRKKRIQHVLARQTSDEIDLMFTGGAKKSLSSQKEMLITADEWEIPPEQVIVEGNIGEGAFGEVLKGAVKGPLSNPKVPRALKSSICIPVAIKMLKASAKGSERRDFLSEIEMMKKVSEGQNPHVVSMVGCVTLQEPLSLITEFVPYGNLLQYLRTNQRLYTDRSEGDGDMATTYTDLGNIKSTDLISFAYQIASGMEYLSSVGIVHRDLACRNILVGEDKVLKITDLGMSRETDEVYVQKTKGRVPLKWMAVESIVTREFTSASDVWAYGVVLWEIGTLGGFPYPTIQNEDLLPLLKRGYRLEKPDNCSAEVYAIMLECWQEDPGKRPTFSGLRARFDSMLLAEKKDTYIDLQIDVSKPYYNPELASDAEILDNLLNVGKLTTNPGKMVSATSPFHLRGISPSHSDFTESPASQRSPRSQSPVQLPEKPPGAASLQPTPAERKNVYVDNPSIAQHGEVQVTLRDRSPATRQGGGESARPASLQLVSGNRNVYVDTPSGRRSIHVTSPPDWSSSNGYHVVSESVPVAGINLNGAVGLGGASEAEGQGGSSTMPEILISFT